MAFVKILILKNLNFKILSKQKYFKSLPQEWLTTTQILLNSLLLTWILLTKIDTEQLKVREEEDKMNYVLDQQRGFKASWLPNSMNSRHCFCL